MKVGALQSQSRAIVLEVSQFPNRTPSSYSHCASMQPDRSGLSRHADSASPGFRNPAIDADRRNTIALPSKAASPSRARPTLTGAPLPTARPDAPCNLGTHS